MFLYKILDYYQNTLEKNISSKKICFMKKCKK
jgi:hypothetical protein